MTVETHGEWLALPVAALRLNLSVEAVRRRLKSGQLRGRRAGGPGGQRWEVLLGGADESAAPTASEARPPTERARRSRLDDGRWLQLMRELLAENGQLGRQLWRLGEERAELYGRCGYLQGQLAAAQEQIRALEAPKAAAAAEGTERRSWWRIFGPG
ncbi:MAG TPA: hypothetical protein VGL23_22165 [Chloroflexota bacterium]|jgi:hypothetical protein